MEKFKQEHYQVVKLANSILDVPYKDPDDNESILARQYLKMREMCELILPMAKGYAVEHMVGNNVSWTITFIGIFKYL